MKKYAALFILSSAISDEQLETKIEQVSSEIVKLGGTVQAATRMGRITFARPLAKKEAGIYVHMVFLMEPAKIHSLHERYRHNEDLIRLQITVAKSSAGNLAAADPPATLERSDCGRGGPPRRTDKSAGEQIPAATRLRPSGYGGQAKKDNFVPGARSLGAAAKQATT